MKKFNLFLCLAWVSANMLASNFTITDNTAKNKKGVFTVHYVGENRTNNYKYTFESYYVDGNNDPQFKLTLERLNTSSTAQVTSSDLEDESCWSTIFEKMTKEMVGEQKELSENLKQVYINDVTLCNSQFAGYNALEYISIEAAENYALLSQSITFTNDKTRKIDCKISGQLTLNTGLITADGDDNLSIYTTTESVAKVWYNYKTTNRFNYTVYLNDEEYKNSTDSLNEVPDFQKYKKKKVRNGQVIIIKDNKSYNNLGAEIK